MSAGLDLTQKPDNIQHPISMKVMRLRRPDFVTKLPLLLEGEDAMGDKLNTYLMFHATPALKKNPKEYLQAQREAAQRSLLQPPSSLIQDKEVNEKLIIDGLGFVDKWILPGSFGKIYVGETFTSYLSLHNNSYNPMKAVSIKVRQ